MREEGSLPKPFLKSSPRRGGKKKKKRKEEDDPQTYSTLTQDMVWCPRGTEVQGHNRKGMLLWWSNPTAGREGPEAFLVHCARGRCERFRMGLPSFFGNVQPDYPRSKGKSKQEAASATTISNSPWASPAQRHQLQP